MENNNTGSRVGTIATLGECESFGPPCSPGVCPPFFFAYYAKWFFYKGVWLKEFKKQTQFMMINVPAWQSTGDWDKSYRISMLMENKIKYKKQKSSWMLPLSNQGRDFSLIGPLLHQGPQIKWVCQILDDLYIWTDLTARWNSYDTLTRRQWIWKMRHYHRAKSETFKAKYTHWIEKL